MPEIHSSHVQLSEVHGLELPDYHPVSGLAVAGLVFGLLSAIALLDPIGWLLPPVGILLSAVALSRIARSNPAMVGRKAALAGLALSVLLGAAAISRSATYNRLVRDEARAFGLAWFQLLAERQPQMAFQLTLEPGDRQPLDSDLWTVYRNSPERRKALKEYVDGPLVKTLLALGEKASVRYWGTEDFSGEEGNETLTQTFSVTYPDAGSTKTFFVDLVLRRPAILRSQGVNWVLARAEGGIRPSWMPEEVEADPAGRR